MSDERAIRFARAALYASTAAPDVIEGELQVLRALCGAKNDARARNFKLAAASAIVIGLGGFLVGVMSGSGEVVMASIGLGVVLTGVFIFLAVSAAPFRDGKRVEKLSEFLRSLDLAPGAPVGAGADFLALRDDASLASPAVRQIAEVPPAFVVGRPWCTARATLANGLDLSLVRSARTHAFTQRGQSTTTSYSYWIVDALAVRYDPQRNPQLAAAPSAAVQQRIVMPQGWEPVAFFAGPGTLAIAAISQHRVAEPDYDARGALDLARQLTSLADPSRAVVALTPQRAPDVAAQQVGAAAAGSAGVPGGLWIGGAIAGLLLAGFSTLMVIEQVGHAIENQAYVDEAEEALAKSRAERRPDVTFEKRMVESSEDNRDASVKSATVFGAIGLGGLALLGVSASRLVRRRKRSAGAGGGPATALSPPGQGR